MASEQAGQFQSNKFVGEFLVSWGAIFDAVDLKSGQSILEYGPGSGQCLLLMARTGIKTFDVDIDAASLEILRRQSDAMGLGVELEQAAFGDGFADKRFYRILFFEAFHHALYFEDVCYACGVSVGGSLDSSTIFSSAH